MAPIRPCPVCETQKTRVLFKTQNSPGLIEKCLNCGMVYVRCIDDSHALIFDGPVSNALKDPKILTSSKLDDVKGSWEFKLLPDKQAEWPALRQNSVNTLQRIEPLLPKNKASVERKILDFGSGWGFFLAIAKELGWDTYGLEPLPASAVYARSMFSLNIVTDTLRENTFPSNFFDVITSFQVFEHLPDPQKDIQHLHKMLRPNGLILLEVPNFETWTMKILRSRHRHFVQDHLNFFSHKTLGQLLARNGFEVVNHYYPTRRMSVRHLFKIWLGKQLHPSILNPLQNLFEKSSLWERSLGLNIGDIVAVIGRKVS